MKVGRRESRTQSLGEVVARWGERIVVLAKIVFVCVAILLLMAYAIEPVREWLIARRWMADTAITEAVGIAFVLTFALLEHLDRQIKRVIHAIAAEQQGRKSNVILGGVGEIYPYVQAAVEDGDKRRKRSIEVLALTLHATWTPFQNWLNSDKLWGWKITLFNLSPQFIRNSGYCPAAWATQAEAVEEAVRKYVKECGQDLKARHIELTLYSCERFPAVHGLRLDGEEIFISFEHWSETDYETLQDPVHFYERIPWQDRSPRGEAYRELFANWIEHARAHAVVIVSNIDVPKIDRGSAQAART